MQNYWPANPQVGLADIVGEAELLLAILNEPETGTKGQQITEFVG